MDDRYLEELDTVKLSTTKVVGAWGGYVVAQPDSSRCPVPRTSPIDFHPAQHHGRSKPTLSKDLSEAEVRERPSQKIPNIICLHRQSDFPRRTGSHYAPVAGQLTYCDDCIQTDLLKKGHFLPRLIELAKWVKDDDGQTKDSTPTDFRSRSQVPKLSLFRPIN
jgi:hypothetical protein